jgi:hypothetical protein
VAFELREGEQKELVVAPGPPIGGPQATAAPHELQKATPRGVSEPLTRDTAQPVDKRTLGYAIGGVGVAGVGTALVLGAFALEKKHLVQDHCRPDRRCDPEGLDAASSGATLSTASTVTFVVGLAAVSAGAYLVLTGKGEKRTALGAAVAPGGGIVSVLREL